jgi:hypothetical protein
MKSMEKARGYEVGERINNQYVKGEKFGGKVGAEYPPGIV